MHATVCLLRAGQPRRAGAAAKSGQFLGQFAWVTGEPSGLKGLLPSTLQETKTTQVTILFPVFYTLCIYNYPCTCTYNL